MLRTEEEIEKRIALVNKQLQAIINLPPGLQPFLREQDYKDVVWILRYEQRILKWVLCKEVY